MTDVSAFVEPGFDPKAWINAACKARPTDEPLERFLAELEMKLQLNAEEVEASVQEASAAAMRRIPYAVGEIHRLRGDIGGLQDAVRALTGRLAADGSAASAAVLPIAALAGVAGRMEAAVSSLREAAELSSGFVRVEEAFAAGELGRVAELLAGMARSLAVVGDVPEFAQGRQRLAALEERLAGAVEGDLAAALAGDDGRRLASAAGVLLAVGRGEALAAAYTASRLARAVAAWEEVCGPLGGSGGAAGGGAVAPAAQGQGWLLAWVQVLLKLLEGEAAWLGGCLPTQVPALVAALAEAVLSKLSKPLAARLEAVGSLPALAGLQADMGVLVAGLGRVLSSAPSASLDKVLLLALTPMEAQISCYGRMEAAQLGSQLAGCIPADAGTEELEVLVERLAGGLGPAFGVLHGALEHCIAISGGTELRGLLSAVDGAAAQYAARLQAAVGILADRFSKSRSGDSDVGVMLALVRLGGALSSALAGLEAQLRAAIATVVPRLEALAAGGREAAAAAAAGGSGAGAELLAARLAAFPAKLPPLSALAVQASQAARFMALPGAAAAADACCAALGEAVYGALLGPVRVALEGFAGLREWRAAGSSATSSGGISLPSFSAYPLPYVTQLGEWLMALPQALEALIVEEGGEGGAEAADGDELAAEWLDKVVTGAAQLLLEAMLSLGEGVSAAGGAQLAADAEYCVNVMGALAVAPSPGLLTVQFFAGQAPQAFVDAASAGVAEGSADGKVLRALARMRGIDWPPAAAAHAAGGGSSAGTSQHQQQQQQLQQQQQQPAQPQEEADGVGS